MCKLMKSNSETAVTLNAQTLLSDIPLFFKSVEGLVTTEVGPVVCGRTERD